MNCRREFSIFVLKVLSLFLSCLNHLLHNLFLVLFILSFYWIASVLHRGVAKARVMAYFGAGTGPIHVDNVQCSGEERSMADCIKQAPGTHNCRHSEDAGVICDYGELQPSYKEGKGLFFRLSREAMSDFSRYLWRITLKKNDKQRREQTWAMISLSRQMFWTCVSRCWIKGAFIGVTQHSWLTGCALLVFLFPFTVTSTIFLFYAVSFTCILSFSKSSIIVSEKLNVCFCNQHTHSSKASFVSVRFCQSNLWSAASAQSPAPNHRGRKLSEVGWRGRGGNGTPARGI